MTPSAVVSSLPANQSEINRVSRMFMKTAPIPLTMRPVAAPAKLPALAVSTPPATMSARPGDDDPSLAEALADEPTGQREEGARQHVDADERAELRVAEPEIADDERRHGGHRLELKSHRRARDEDDRQRNPAIGHVAAII